MMNYMGIIILVVIMHIHRLVNIDQMNIKVHHVQDLLILQQNRLITLQVQIIQPTIFVSQQVILKQEQHIHYHLVVKVVVYRNKHFLKHIVKLFIDDQVQRQVSNHRAKLNINGQVVHR